MEIARREAYMATYRMVYVDDEQVIRQTFHDVQVYRDGRWTVLFRGKHAVLRVRDEHVQSLEVLTETVEPESTPEAHGLTVGDLMRPAVTSVERLAHLAAATYLLQEGRGQRAGGDQRPRREGAHQGHYRPRGRRCGRRW